MDYTTLPSGRLKQVKAQSESWWTTQNSNTQQLSGSPQEIFQNPTHTQWQQLQDTQHTRPQNSQAVLGQQFCAPHQTTFYIKDRAISWSGIDISIADDRGSTVLKLHSKAFSFSQRRTLTAVTDQPVCTLQPKVRSDS